MTSRNEKKEESDSWFQEFKSLHDAMRAKNTDIYRQLSDSKKEIEGVICKTPVEKQLLMLAYAAIDDDIFLLNLGMLLQYQNYTVALQSKLLHHKMAGLDTASLENEIQRAKREIKEETAQAKNEVDTHLAKRLKQLLDFEGHEGMYDTGTKPSGAN